MNEKVKSPITICYVPSDSCNCIMLGISWGLTGAISKDNSKSYKTDEEKELLWGYKVIGQEKPKNHKNYVKIAILDSGINKSHKEFKDLTFYEYNATKPKKSIEDDYGHGTAIAGIIAATGEEIKGISQNAIIYDVKVLNKNGKGKVEDVVNGIKWCIEQKVDIINISFGFGKDYDELRYAIKSALDNNIIITAASGNTLGLTVEYPAKYEGVLSISSLNEKLKIDPISAKGKIDFSAPGVNIKTTDKYGGYTKVEGTSFATGAIGCLYSKKNKSKLNIHQTLKKNTVDLGNLGYDREYGNGMIICNKGEN
ncbi:S8 family serine peptidase [Bacillus zhangzhouensis]|nr:S8 family serine peptidase [Bacillus zhangzhouensis]